jgi:hypothetical protein
MKKGRGARESASRGRGASVEQPENGKCGKNGNLLHLQSSACVLPKREVELMPHCTPVYMYIIYMHYRERERES